jgi:hypothetical protein
MNNERKSCCVRAMGWSLVGIVIALAWGIGNLSSGMGVLSAFAIPALIVVAILGVVVLATLEVSWFKRLCVCPNRGSGDDRKDEGMAGMPH